MFPMRLLRACTRACLVPLIMCGSDHLVQSFPHRPNSTHGSTNQELTEWDKIAGDGDCGTTFSRGAQALVAALDADGLPKEDLRALLRALSDRWLSLVLPMLSVLCCRCCVLALTDVVRHAALASATVEELFLRQ